VLSKATLPLTLWLSAAGALSATLGGTALSDDQLAAALAVVYASPVAGSLWAVAVQVPATAPRELDVAARARILSAAAGRAWVVPVFVPFP
jgi:hypothetical protein